MAPLLWVAWCPKQMNKFFLLTDFNESWTFVFETF